jgi:thiol-disulfide isomerase/thioredoxin
MKKISIGVLLLLFAANAANAKALKFDAEYQTDNQQKISLNTYIGHQPVYLKFWASWCMECRQELPNLEKNYVKYKDRIAMFAVNLNINETAETIKNFHKNQSMTIPIVLDNNGSIARNFTFKGTPFHVLINARGKVVYTTYKDDAQLATNLAQLAGERKVIADKNVLQVPANNTTNAPLPTGLSLVFFSTTWCDWYMKDLHPEMASNCINAINTVDQLYRSKPELSLQAYVTHLWTEEKDLDDYRRKFSIPYPVSIDQNNERFQHHHAQQYPTLIVFKNGKEIARFTQFDNPEHVLKALGNL